ncbi:unannotated protein [freshwater metagenome]|uniref:Unannotated protein n=1 Tax=freshwater metagenome TaxID=449393 RepID=A0A6J6Y1W7_9ZZZZ
MIGVKSRPRTKNEPICTSGKARPMVSASTIGNPNRDAHMTGSTPFEPPISLAMIATTGLLKTRSTSWRSRCASPPLFNISNEIVGAPIPQMGIIKPSAVTSSSWTTETGPNFRIALLTSRIAPPTLPPPPVPRSAHPKARSSTSSLLIWLIWAIAVVLFFDIWQLVALVRCAIL